MQQSKISPALVATLVALGLLSLPYAQADDASVPATLPSSLTNASSVFDGTYVYIFGGDKDVNGNQLTNQILRFDPATNSVVTLGSVLPSARADTAAVWDGSGNAYIFGGETGATRLTSIVRFTPSTGTVTTLSSVLPEMRASMGAVWSGGSAYLLGGYTFGSGTDDIIQFTPSTGTVTKLSNKLPFPVANAAAVLIGGKAYQFGGINYNTLVSTNAIVQFDPATQLASTMGATLPSPRAFTAAAATSTDAFVFGGFGTGGGNAQVVRYNPAADTRTVMAATLPSSRHDSTAAWANGAAYVFGGTLNFNQVVKYTIEPDAPTSLAVSTSSTAGQLDLGWTAPPSNSYVPPLSGYKVYRSASATGTFTQVGTATGTTFSDTGLGNGVTRHYRVTAYTADGESPVSNTASARTATVPTAPLGLDATAGPGLQQITVTWSAPADTGGLAYSYNLYRNSGSGWAFHANTGTATSFTDSGLALLGTYSYRVTATNALGEGPVSNTDCARPFPVGTVVDLVLPC